MYNIKLAAWSKSGAYTLQFTYCSKINNDILILQFASLQSSRFGGSCHSFYLFCLFHKFIITFYINTFFHIHSPRPLSFSSLLVTLRGKNLPGVPSRDLNSGLRLQQASALPTEPRCTPAVFLSELTPWYSEHSE
jgi:hypothetical protein